MKKFLLSAFFLLTVCFSFGQADSLLKWQVNVKRIADSNYQLKATTSVPKDWNLYAINPTVDGLQEAILVSYDYENAKNKNPLVAEGTTKEITDATFNNQKVTVYNGTLSITQELSISGTIPEKLNGKITAFLGKKDEFQPAEYSFSLKLEGGVAAASNTKRILIENADAKHPLNNCGNEDASDHSSLLTVLLLGFFGGLIALLTPCVFPMIPVTVFSLSAPTAESRQ